MRALLIALQFLTILPVRLQGEFTAQDIGRSLLFYPVVGLLIGIVLSLLGWNLTSQSPMFSAILVLAVWVTITGALHIDGLADSADAWLGGIGDKAKTLSIMKDPAAGPIAVVTIVLVLLIKFVMLTVLLAEQNWWALICAAPRFRQHPQTTAIWRAYTPVDASHRCIGFIQCRPVCPVVWVIGFSIATLPDGASIKRVYR
jgi:adenosylcobinamide-GDP ribazoletransferase